MQIHMKDLIAKGGKNVLKEELNVDELLNNQRDVLSAGPLDVSLEAAGEHGVVKVEGELSIDLKMACSRCLEPVSKHTVIPVSELFKPVAKLAPEEDVDGEEDNENEIIEVEGDKLDLRPYVEEALLLYLPFAPLCSAECKGLCPSCGTDLNTGACGCSNEVIDPRFAALKDLFKD